MSGNKVIFSMIALKSAVGLKAIFDNNSAVVSEVEVSSGRGGKKKILQKNKNK